MSETSWKPALKIAGTLNRGVYVNRRKTLPKDTRVMIDAFKVGTIEWHEGSFWKEDAYLYVHLSEPCRAWVRASAVRPTI